MAKKNPSVNPFEERPDYLPQEEFEIPKDDRFGPKIKLIQGLSPELDPSNERFISGVTQGDIVVVGKLNEALEIINLGEILEFVPVAIRKSWSEFVPRKQGGGFVALYTSEEDLKRGYTPGNEVQMSIDVMVMVEAVEEPVLLQFNTPTKLKPARTFAAALEKFKTLHGMVFGLKATGETNRQQQRYFNYQVQPLRWSSKETFEAVKQIAAGSQLFLSASTGSGSEGGDEM